MSDLIVAVFLLLFLVVIRIRVQLVLRVDPVIHVGDLELLAPML